MRFKQLILMTYAITAGALAIGLTSDYTKALKFQYAEAKASLATPVMAKAPSPPPMASVVTIAKNLRFGHRLSAGDLKIQQWPVGAVPKSAFASVDAVFAAYKKPHARIELVEGEILLPDKIKQKDEGSDLALVLPADRRAVTIKVNEVRGVGGFVKPNDHVDVILTEKNGATKEKSPARFSRVLLQNVRVLAVGQEIRSKGAHPKVANSVTVAVSLDDAQKLALATTVGHLSLALRSPGQKRRSSTNSISLDDLKPTKKVRKSGYMRVVIHRAAATHGRGRPKPIVIERDNRP